MGLNPVTKVLPLEWAPHGLTVNAIAPTSIYSPETAERLDDAAFLAGLLANILIGPMGTTANVAAAASAAPARRRAVPSNDPISTSWIRASSSLAPAGADPRRAG